LAGKAKAGMVHSVSGWMRGVQVKLWDPLSTRAIPERLRDVFTTKRYTNPSLPLPSVQVKAHVSQTYPDRRTLLISCLWLQPTKWHTCLHCTVYKRTYSLTHSLNTRPLTNM